MSSGNSSNETATRGEEKFFLIIVIALALVTGIGSWFAVVAFSAKEKVRGIPPDKERQLVNFAFTDSSGREVTQDEMRGKILVVSFLFTACSLTCPEVSKRMAEIQKLTADAPDVRLLSLTVDPRSDTPPVLMKWGERFGADTNRWNLLTGDQAQLHFVIGKISWHGIERIVRLHRQETRADDEVQLRRIARQQIPAVRVRAEAFSPFRQHRRRVRTRIHGEREQTHIRRIRREFLDFRHALADFGTRQ